MGCCCPKQLPDEFDFSSVKFKDGSPCTVRLLRPGDSYKNDALDIMVSSFCGTKDRIGELMFDWVLGDSSGNTIARESEDRANQFRFVLTILFGSCLRYGVVVGLFDQIEGKEVLVAVAALERSDRTPAYEGWNVLCTIPPLLKKAYPLMKYDFTSKGPKDVQHRAKVFNKYSTKDRNAIFTLLKKNMKTAGVNFKKEYFYFAVCIGTHPVFQGKGYGRMVMEAIDCVARGTEGIPRPIYLECCREGNIGFYRDKCGYVEECGRVFETSGYACKRENVYMIKHANGRVFPSGKIEDLK